MKNKPEPGTRVRLTDKFLQLLENTEYRFITEGTITACNCDLCKDSAYVAIEPPNEDGQRHIHIENLKLA